MKLRHAVLPLALALSLPSLADAARGFEVRDMAYLDRHSSPTLSPDGRVLVFAKRVVDKQTNKASSSLWMRNLATRDLRPPHRLTGLLVDLLLAGLTVAQMNDLRSKMRAQGGTVKVAKNRLAKIALKDTQYEQLSDMLTGPVALATSSDPVAAAKVAIDFAKTNDKLVVLGGAMGATTLDAEAVKSLATLPSLDELRAKLLGMTPAAREAWLFEQNF